MHGCISYQIQQKSKDLKHAFRTKFCTPIQLSVCNAEIEYAAVQIQLHLDTTNIHLANLEISLANSLKTVKADYDSFVQ